METVTKAQARRIWLRAQKLDEVEPFGRGPAATQAAVEHLGYVQIDTINVLERSHHHILFTRIPEYRRSDLHHAQTHDKSVFEYWTHALSYVPTRDLKYFMRDMRLQRNVGGWYSSVTPQQLQKVVRTIRKEGPISIRDIDDDVLVEKDHEWASRKPSKKALQKGFYTGKLAISERIGMLKKYELAERHFGLPKPKPASESQINVYLLDRALRSQGLISLDSVCYLRPKKKPEILKVVESRVRRGELIEFKVRDAELVRHWGRPEILDQTSPGTPDQTHLLSPFDPLVIQRKKLQLFFDYEHRFEAYLPKEKRKFGYYALPVLVGDTVVAAIDLKTDRAAGKLRIQKWTWIGRGRAAVHKKIIEAELHRFQTFLLQM